MSAVAQVAGRWRSPLDPASVSGGVRRSQVTLDASGCRWLEHDFVLGRARVMHCPPGGPPRAVTPAGVDVGSLVWEYGGGCHLAVDGALVYSDRDDQRLYRLEPGDAPQPLTPAAPQRFADGAPAPGGRWLAYVRETHEPGAAVAHAIVAVSARGEWAPRPLAHGRDFYAAPRISPDGTAIAWLCWHKPDMQWDASELWLAPLGPDGAAGPATRVAGGPGESILAPQWSPAGVLHWLSDRSGWWNLEALCDGVARPLAPQAADLAGTPWQLGLSSYGFLADGTIVAVQIRDAVHRVVRIDPGRATTEDLRLPFTAIEGAHLACHGTTVAFAGATPGASSAVVTVDVRDGAVTRLAADDPPCDERYLAVPEAIAVRRDDGVVSQAFLHRPCNPEATRPAGERIPLVVNLHGGPTDHARCARHEELALWTSRGFLVADLNYSGSSGFGRDYRHRLHGGWGREDFADCEALVRQLVRDEGVDATRVFARGTSAGGYLTLQCAARSPLFVGGLCRSGIADLAAWREDTHDFESRYADRLVGPPGDAALWAQRSPARNVGVGAAPVLVVHGSADPVVPIGQAHAIADAYRRAGRPHRVEILDGEPHDLRHGESTRSALTAELAFCTALL